MPFEIVESAETQTVDDGFLMLSHAGCDACKLMKHSFELLESEGHLQAKVLMQEFEEDSAFSEAVLTYKIEDFPTLILYQDGVEIRRWKGFFQEPIDIAASKLREILESTIRA